MYLPIEDKSFFRSGILLSVITNVNNKRQRNTDRDNGKNRATHISVSILSGFVPDRGFRSDWISDLARGDLSKIDRQRETNYSHFSLESSARW